VSWKFLYKSKKQYCEREKFSLDDSWKDEKPFSGS
jgi:hypothetical protein